jgi:hypothetical protein
MLLRCSLRLRREVEGERIAIGWLLSTKPASLVECFAFKINENETRVRALIHKEDEGSTVQPKA